MRSLRTWLSFSLPTFLFLLSDFAYAQQLTPDNQGKVREIQLVQGLTTEKTLKWLETGDYDRILVFVDAAYVKSHKPDIMAMLTEASREINKYKETTKVSDGLIVYDKKHNTYRCSYYDTTGEKFLIDIYYMQGDAYSRIMKFSIKKKEELDREREENIEQSRKDNNLPPPPPPVKKD